MPFWLKIVFAFIFPPLAVYNHGCMTMLVVGVLTVFGIFPGTILALLIISKNE